MDVGRDHRRLAIRYARGRFRRNHGRASASSGLSSPSSTPCSSHRGAPVEAADGGALGNGADKRSDRRSTPPLRILGLFALALAVLLLCWIDLSHAEQYGLIAQLIYPASLGVALVLIFDKATRAWGTKGGAETAREWLLCDLLIFLLVVAFLNLRSVAKPDAYASSFWDIVNVVLFFAAFWLIDRTSSRSRFLIGYGYLIVLPLLLLIWDTVQGIATSASWWASMWPFLIVAVVFFVLEVVTLVSSTGERQTLPAIKDALFVVIYAVLLIVAVQDPMPERARLSSRVGSTSCRSRCDVLQLAVISGCRASANHQGAELKCRSGGCSGRLWAMWPSSSF